MHRLMYSCRRAAELTSRGMEEPLPGLQRLLLRAHLAMCAGCRNFSRQARLLRAISHRYPDALEREERQP